MPNRHVSIEIRAHSGGERENAKLTRRIVFPPPRTHPALPRAPFALPYGYSHSRRRAHASLLRCSFAALSLSSSPESLSAECNFVCDAERPDKVCNTCEYEPEFCVRAGPRAQIYFKPEEVHAAIVNCGGLCPGINDVVRSVVNTLEVGYDVKKISGKGRGVHYRSFALVSFYYKAAQVSKLFLRVCLAGVRVAYFTVNRSVSPKEESNGEIG